MNTSIKSLIFFIALYVLPARVVLSEISILEDLYYSDDESELCRYKGDKTLRLVDKATGHTLLSQIKIRSGSKDLNIKACSGGSSRVGTGINGKGYIVMDIGKFRPDEQEPLVVPGENALQNNLDKTKIRAVSIAVSGSEEMNNSDNFASHSMFFKVSFYSPRVSLYSFPYYTRAGSRLKFADLENKSISSLVENQECDNCGNDANEMCYEYEYCASAIKLNYHKENAIFFHGYEYAYFNDFDPYEKVFETYTFDEDGRRIVIDGYSAENNCTLLYEQLSSHCNFSSDDCPCTYLDMDKYLVNDTDSDSVCNVNKYHRIISGAFEGSLTDCHACFMYPRLAYARCKRAADNPVYDGLRKAVLGSDIGLKARVMKNYGPGFYNCYYVQEDRLSGEAGDIRRIGCYKLSKSISALKPQPLLRIKTYSP